MSTNITGQIVFTAKNLNLGGIWELDINWVQPKKGLDALLGAAPEYDRVPFLEAIVRYHPQHGVEFKKQTTTIGLKHGQQYAALVSWHGRNDEKPFLLSVCTLEAFNKARVKPTVVTAETAKVPLGTFRVSVLGHVESGDLHRIMNIFTQKWVEDPTKALQSEDAKWGKKEGMRYISLPQPPALPPVNKMVLTAACNSTPSLSVVSAA